jgi:glutamate dehydrogenase
MNFSTESTMYQQIEQSINENLATANENLAWLQTHMHPYFFITMAEETEAVGILATILKSLQTNKRRILADTDQKLILARLNKPGTLYDTLRTIRERDISYAHIALSYAPIPGLDSELELQRFEFDRKSHKEISDGLKAEINIPAEIRESVAAAMTERYPDFDLKNLDKLLNILWLNNQSYVTISPAERVAQTLWLYQQGKDNDGIHLDIEETKGIGDETETRIMFAVSNPPQRDFLLQIMEVFNRLDIGLKRTYCLTLSNGTHPFFLGSFYLEKNGSDLGDKSTELFAQLQEELFNTQLLQTRSHTYQEFVTNKIMVGEDATLVNAFIAFCHTNLAHSSDVYDLEGVERAFHSHPDLCLQLVELFRTRFDPATAGREGLYAELLDKAVQTVEGYNTGHKRVDSFRRTIFRCCLSFIRNTLKTNFFVVKKQALSFRVDPIYLSELKDSFTDDLPAERPFRITFFFGRYGAAYHIGFSDIARGGWRTLIANGRDDYVTCADTMFKENYVLAHTQHLKNKDIYEGGSKMVAVLNAVSVKDPILVNQRLYKLQYSFINAFLDIYASDENGKVQDPNVVDYYGEEEAIELGPDENMHDIMIDTIAKQAKKRNYVLGIGVMSGKEIGINHKEFGVTSAGVVKFAEITMEEMGIDYSKDEFSVKLTGGPGGDVAGNAMLLLIDRCPKVKINLILDGTGAMYDPAGADHEELRKILLTKDLDAYNPEKMHPGAFMLFRGQRRTEGLRELYKKVVCTESGLEEQWISVDEFYREFNNLPFTVEADLFIPGGGRPETIDIENWQKFFTKEGKPSARAIVEGANSFITPAARVELQKKGVIVMRDASANKCGVISSSYEIIANLVMGEEEFIEHKKAYVADVLSILERRAEDEARLIFKRYREADGTKLYTEISDGISKEINKQYADLFTYFLNNPEECKDPLFQKAIYSHLPNFLSDNVEYHDRIQQLPAKYLYAILAVEIASSMTYRGSKEGNMLVVLKGHLNRLYSNAA